MIAAYIQRLRAILWRLIYPRAVEIDMAAHLRRLGATQTGRVRR